MHPTLAKVLASWKLEHWERIYGRAPTDDDLVVPTRTMKPVAVEKAAKGMKADLKALKVRVEAGKHRPRGGQTSAPGTRPGASKTAATPSSSARPRTRATAA
jgi:hypothetical protein